MEELYRIIENKIKDSGCPLEIEGREFYNDISAEADEQSEGQYMFVIKKNDSLSYQGCMTILKDQFDLHFVDIHVEELSYHINFDE